MSISVNQKVKIERGTECVYGTITHVYPPCEFHSGRFTVHIHEKGYETDAEFWFSDYRKTVKDLK